MSIIEKKSTILDGISLCGSTQFEPCDETSSYAFVERNGQRCGVIYETANGGYIRFSPAWQLPEGTRKQREWNKFVFESDDDGLLDVNVDFRDGEVRYIDSEIVRDDIASIEASIEHNVEFLTSLYDEFIRYVSIQLVNSPDE